MLKMWIVVWRCCWDVASYCAYELILMNTTLIDKYRFTDDVVYLSIPNKKLGCFLSLLLIVISNQILKGVVNVPIRYDYNFFYQ